MSQPTAPALGRQAGQESGQWAVCSGQSAARDDLLAAVEASDDLASYALLENHPRAALRDAASELAELAQAGDEVLLYASEVQHD